MHENRKSVQCNTKSAFEHETARHGVILLGMYITIHKYLIQFNMLCPLREQLVLT